MTGFDRFIKIVIANSKGVSQIGFDGSQPLCGELFEFSQSVLIDIDHFAVEKIMARTLTVRLGLLTGQHVSQGHAHISRRKIDDRRRAAVNSGLRPRLIAIRCRCNRIRHLHMHMRINKAGKNVTALGIPHFVARLHLNLRGYFDNLACVNRQICLQRLTF